MFKSVRVILSLVPGQFLSGLSRARNAFSGFMGFLKGGISTGHMLFTGLNQAVQLVGTAIRFVANGLKTLKEAMLDGAIAQERFHTQMRTMLGDSELADQIIGSLDERILKYGLDAEDAYGATVQFTMGLKGMDGAVDPNKMEMLLNMMQRIKALRPDIVGGEQAIARGLITALQGDFSTLTRLLDIPLNKLQGLSAEAQAFLNKTGEAKDQQLGQVTALGSQVESDAQNAINVLDELLNAAGITQDVVDEMQQTTDSRIDQVLARWEEFKIMVGEQVLPTLNEKLGEFIDFLDEHQTEIDAFAEALGKLASEGFEELADKLMNIDWSQVGEDAREFAEDVRYVVEQLALLIEKANEFGDWYNRMGGKVEGEGDMGGSAGIGQQAGENVRESIYAWLNEMGPKVFPNMDERVNSRRGEADQQTPSQGPQEINVTVTVDGEQNIRAAVDNAARQAANREVGDFVNEVVRSTGAGH